MSGIEPDSPDSCSCGGRVSPLTRTNTGRKSLGYRRLPPQSLRLSVLKLDGSCFDIQVPRTGTVSELKDAVEKVFSQLSKTRESRISWSLVWGHFCLSYEGHKLLDDKACIRHLGVKDDDQNRAEDEQAFGFEQSDAKWRYIQTSPGIAG